MGLWFLALCQVPGAGATSLEIDVVGLFKDAALFEIDGTQQLLRTGEISPEGVSLLEASSRGAVIEVNGRRLFLDLSSKISAEFRTADNASVSISLNDNGQYRTMGSINGRAVALLVDTGANIVALNTNIARLLGIDFRAGRKSTAVTASGRVNSWEVTLASVQVGAISVSNVRAAVLEGDYPEDVLLGMTFLGSVEINHTNGVLVLTSRL
ncbi:MAG: TIGR02281 family clan AA aspartic protease [Pseudomonadota bacterium]